MFVDSHSHIEMPDFDSDRQEVLQRAVAAGVHSIVVIGNGDYIGDSHDKAAAIADSHSSIFTTVGLHPHEARFWNANTRAHILELSQYPRVIGWGEIGLDYHYDNSPREIQQLAFREQLRLAADRKIPVIIHTREAESDTLSILREEWADND